MDYKTADLPSLINAVNNVAAETKSAFAHLSPSQFNWKPSPERWSVAQCFDHLLTTNRGYFPVIDEVIAGRKQTFWQSMPLLSGLSGKLLIKYLDPASTRKQQAKRVTEKAAFPK